MTTLMAGKTYEDALRYCRKVVASVPHPAPRYTVASHEIITACAWGCKRVKIDGAWVQDPGIDELSKSHGCCPDCCRKQYPLVYERLKARGEI